MTDDITDFIRASREICDEATPGEWLVDEGGAEHGLGAVYQAQRGGFLCDSDGHMSVPDARFIAHARTALPRALDMLESQQKQIADLHETISTMITAQIEDMKQLADQQAEIERITALALTCADWRHCDCFTEYDITVICERCKMCAEIKGEDR